VLIYRSGTSGALRSGWKAVLAAAVCFFIGIALLGPVSQQSISGKLSTSPDSRREIAVTTLEAIKDNFPLGSGLGSFSSLYRLYEDPQQATREYTNRAHNDYLELWLETGIVGLLLVFSFVLWWLRQSAKAWRSDLTGMQIARSASVIVGIVLMHSLVDYPLRTSSIAALFATACAFLLPPPAQRRRSRPRSTETLNHLEAHA
jgi:O-antigen ligase